MRKKINIVSILVILTSLLLTLNVAYAADVSTLDRIDLEISIDENGDAHIKESWNANVTSGSEASKSLIHLNGSEVSDFEVHNESGKQYKLMQPWDSEKNRIDKFTSCGLMERMSGDVSLFWGLGDYGTRAYILDYNISNFVKKCRDAQFTYFTLVAPGTRPYPKKIKATISVPDNVDTELIEVYGYGFEGEQQVTKGSNQIVLESYDRKMTPDSYMVVLIKFNSNSFNTTLSSNKGFQEILTEANEGQGLGVVTQPVSLKNIVSKLIVLIIAVLIVMYIMSTIRMRKRLKNELGLPVKFIFDKSTKELKTLEEVEPCDILKNGDSVNLIYEIYTIGLQYRLIQNSYSIFGAMIIRWILNGNVILNSGTDDGQGNGQVELILVKEPSSTASFEVELYKMLAEISDDNSNRIDTKDIERWFRENHNRFTEWADEIIRSESRVLQDKGLCNVIAVGGRIQKKIDFIEYKTTEQLSNRANEIQGFKRYIKEMHKLSKGNTVEAIDNYIVYAQLFNITNILFEQIELIKKDNNLVGESFYQSLSVKEANSMLIALNKLASLVTMRIESSKKSSRHKIVNKK